MNKRIAPIEMPNHFEAIEYLNELSIQWKLRRAGEPHTLTLEFIGRWRTIRKRLETCTKEIDTWAYLGDRPFKIPMKHNKHGFEIQTVDRIILDLEAEYGWPAPLQPLVNELDIQQLRQAIRDIEACRSEPKIYS